MNRILFTTINFLIVIGIFFGLILPKFGVLKELNLKIELKKAEVQAQEDYFKNLKDISTEIAAHPEEVSKVNSALPDTLSVSSTISFLQKISLSNGLILKKIDFAQPARLKENQNIFSLPIFMDVVGSYTGFKNFLLNLEKTSRLVEVESISFSYPTRLEKEGYSFRLGLRVYSY